MAYVKAVISVCVEQLEICFILFYFICSVTLLK